MLETGDCNEPQGKVMFSEASDSHSVHRAGV